MARLLSVNVGRPREIAWRGKTVSTAVWKEPVEGRRLVRRLNVDGDAQGDLDGHGGEPAANPLSGVRRAVQIAPQHLLENSAGPVRSGGASRCQCSPGAMEVP